MSPASPLNRTVWITSVVLGTTLASGGFHHGLFGTLQGNRPTPGFAIQSIGPEHVRWEYGTDDPITLIPNFLLTGVAAMALSLAIVAWSALGLLRRRGPSVFLGLFVLLTLAFDRDTVDSAGVVRDVEPCLRRGHRPRRLAGPVDRWRSWWILDTDRRLALWRIG